MSHAGCWSTASCRCLFFFNPGPTLLVVTTRLRTTSLNPIDLFLKDYATYSLQHARSSFLGSGPSPTSLFFFFLLAVLIWGNFGSATVMMSSLWSSSAFFFFFFKYDIIFFTWNSQPRIAGKQTHFVDWQNVIFNHLEVQVPPTPTRWRLQGRTQVERGCTQREEKRVITSLWTYNHVKLSFLWCQLQETGHS